MTCYLPIHCYFSPKPPCNIILGPFVARIQEHCLCFIAFHQFTQVEKGCKITDPSRLLKIMCNDDDGILFFKLMNKLFNFCR